MKTDAEKELPFIVSVWTGNGEGKQSFVGTGVLINGRTVLTCKHVAREAFRPGGGARHAAWVSHPSLEFPGWQASEKFCHETHDIAVITLSEDVANSHQTPYPWILTEVTRSEWHTLISSQHFSNCRIQGYPASEAGGGQYTHDITRNDLGQPTWHTATGAVVRAKVIHQGIENRMSGSPCLIRNDNEWYLLGMAYLGGVEATDSVLHCTPIITEFLDGQKVEYKKLSVGDFLTPPEGIAKIHRLAQGRIQAAMVEILDKNESVRNDLACEIANVCNSGLGRASSSADVQSELQQMNLTEFVDFFQRLDNSYSEQNGRGVKDKRRLLAGLYWTGLSEKLPGDIVSECRRLLHDGSSLPVLIPIPSRDRAIVGVVMAGAEGRKADLTSSGPEKSLRSRREMSLENLPESGVKLSNGEVVKVAKESLDLRKLDIMDPDGWLNKIRVYLQSEVRNNQRVFVVAKGWSPVKKKVTDYSWCKTELSQLFPELVWVDMTSNKDQEEILNSQDIATNPLLNNLLQP